MYTKVKAGLYHKFECLEDGIAYELYWAEFATTILKENLWGSWVMNMTSYTTNFDHVKTFMKTFGQEVKDEPEFPTKRLSILELN